MFTALAVAILLQAAPQASEAFPFDATARVREAIEVVRPVAYRSEHVDWAAMEAEMLQYADGARDTADMLPAYQTLVFGLGDGHSFQQPPAEATAAWRERHGDRRLRPDLPPRPHSSSSFASRSAVEHQDVLLREGRSARLVVAPAFAGGGARGEAYADHVFNAVADAPAGTCGYIVDLRGNGGGNVWPMLAGLSGLLGDSPQGLFENADGTRTTYARLENGRAFMTTPEEEEGDGLIASAPSWRPLPHLSAAPVAVLVDGGTASSGEGVALAFVARTNTRSFGARTYGVASANEGYMLSDGVNLVITVAMMVDPAGAIHPSGYHPDIEVDADGTAAVEAAQEWLARLPQCGG